MKKLLFVFLAASLLTIGITGCNDYNDKNSDDQTCNDETFELKCDSDGHSVLYCNNGKVDKYDCQIYYDEEDNEVKDTKYSCAKTTSETNNFVECIYDDPEEKCDTVNETDSFCSVDFDYGFEAEYQMKCIQFDNGQKYWTLVEEKLCSNLCDDGCTVQTCTAGTAPSCADGLALNCVKMEDGTAQFVALDCDWLEAECVIETEEDLTYATCGE